MNMNTIMWRFVIFLVSLLTVLSSHAQGIGEYAGELIEPVHILSNFISSGSLIVGAMLLVAALMRFLQYRVNPLASPLSTVIMLLVLGIMLVALPFIYLLLDAGIPFTLFGHSYA